MIGSSYWATGIQVVYGYSGSGAYGWAAQVEYYDDGWAGDDNPAEGIVVTEGILRSRYYLRGDGNLGLTAAVDAVKHDAEQLGIEWKTGTGLGPHVYYKDDGEHPDGYPAPEGWREMVNAQSRRLGWEPAYREAVQP